MMILVSLPRFGALDEPANRASHEYTTQEGRVLPGLTIDMREYLHLTEYYAGSADAPDLAPFTTRLGVPWLAGRLPWEAPISLNVVVLAFLAVGLVALVAAMRRLGCALGPIAGAVLVWSVSFPVYYWGSFNYVDGAVVGLLAVVVLSLVYGRLLPALLVLAGGLLIKESMLVAVPVVVVWVHLSGWQARRRVEAFTATAVAAVVGVVGARVIGPEAKRFYNPWFPTPKEMHHYAGANIGRVGPMGQVFLSGVIPIGLAYLAWRRHKAGELGLDRRTFWTLMSGVLCGILLSFHAFIAAQWDGRTIWTVYPFALALGAVALSPRTAPEMSADPEALPRECSPRSPSEWSGGSSHDGS
jgi:hypothetical protein